jgi:hypothetical protein
VVALDNNTTTTPCQLILKPYGNHGVLILRPDSWRERPWSTYTPRGQKVLNLEAVILPKILESGGGGGKEKKKPL